MMNFALITALFCTYSWISVSGSEVHTVEVQPGEEVTLLCSNFTKHPSHVFWFKVADRLNISCISSMITADGNVSLYDGFQNGKFNMTSNSTTLFLGIKQVDLSDAGLYFCGVKYDRNPVIVSATFLKVSRFQDEFDASVTKLMSATLAALVIFLVLVVTGLAVKIRKLTAHTNGQNQQHSEDVGSHDLNYAALSFHSKAKHSRTSSENQQGSDVVYAATR